MPFNGPIDGDYTNVDFTEGPWTDHVCMTLTHEECLQVLAKFEEIIAAYKPEENYGDPLSEMTLHSSYNKDDWQYAINNKTFLAARSYNPEFNTLGINDSGVVLEEEVVEPEEPMEEEETIFPEETTPEEDTTEVVQENEAPTEETTTEDPAE
jgi:hypothetical protein